MNQKNKKYFIIPLDGFQIVLLLSSLFALLSVIFIFTTAKPEALKMVRWSAVSSTPEILRAFSTRAFPALQTSQGITFWGLEKINLNSAQTAQLIASIAQVVPHEDLEFTPPFAQAEKSSTTQPIHFILNPQLQSINLDVFIESYEFNQFTDLNPDEFYDSKSLKKALRKLDTTSASNLLFTIYQKQTSAYYIDVIRLK